jgi:hypothetical protein
MIRGDDIVEDQPVPVLFAGRIGRGEKRVQTKVAASNPLFPGPLRARPRQWLIRVSAVMGKIKDLNTSASLVELGGLGRCLGKSCQ